MPRYRFRWENLDPSLLEALCPDARDVEGRVERLRATYGARPKADFVAEVWPVLRDRWLPADEQRLATVVQALRGAGLGRTDIDVTTPQGCATYLQSCRNAASLRSIVLAEVIRAGEGSSASLVKRVPPAWPEFEASLAIALAGLTKDQFLVLTLKGTGRLVQFAAQGSDGMRAEAVSNAFLQGDDRLTQLEIDALLAAGWRAPTSDASATASEDPDGSPNFWREWPDPVPCDEVAHAAIAVLRDIDGAPHAGFVQIEAFDAHGAAVAVPALGIDAKVPAVDERAAAPLLTRPRDPDELRKAVHRVVTSLSEDAVVFDEDGDIPISWGSARLYVRVLEELPIVRIFSPIVSGIAITSQVREAVNDVNRDRSVVRALWSDDTVVVTADLFAATFSEDNFVNVLHAVAETADELDDDFAARFTDQSPGRPGYGGYL